jgi:S1-C subfamily serine protease
MEGGEGAGVRVTRVLEDSGAERAGLASGDLITALDGRAVSSPSEIRIAMIDRGPGDRILITLQRDSDGSVQTLDYEVRLGGG